jgi:hypothetical protein
VVLHEGYIEGTKPQGSEGHFQDLLEEFLLVLSVDIPKSESHQKVQQDPLVARLAQMSTSLRGQFPRFKIGTFSSRNQIRYRDLCVTFQTNEHSTGKTHLSGRSILSFILAGSLCLQCILPLKN